MQHYWKGMGSLSTIGLEIALAVVLCMLAGHWLDGKLDSSPTATIGGFVLGILVAWRSLMRALERANREAAAEEAKERSERQRYLEKHDRDRPNDEGP